MNCIVSFGNALNVVIQIYQRVVIIALNVGEKL